MSARSFESRAESHTGNSSPSLRLTLSVDESNSAISIHAGTESDEELVTKAKSGDQPAFAELCRRYGWVLKRRIYRIVRNHHDAEDITQESLIRAYTHLAAFQCHRSFQTWLTRIAINSSLMHLRKRRLHSQASMDVLTTEGGRVRSWEIPDPAPNPEQHYDANQRSVMVTRAVEKLSPGIRQVVEHYRRDEGRLVDVANASGITLAAPKSRLLHARKLLRRRLENV
ncbi:MAG TPA: sigma-70 family RNA polymerase sigma factor [Acidobacteriaceae bacterium]